MIFETTDFVFRVPPMVSRARRVLIKPSASYPVPYPVTTSPDMMSAIIAGIRRVSDADILILEGTPGGAPARQIYKSLGYDFPRVLTLDVRDCVLVEVDNPSKAFLSQRWGEAIGSAVVSTLEGSRPLLVEIQALTNPTSFGLPRRTANGVDFGRLLMITAVLTKRVGLRLGNQDIIANVTGGLKIGEPAADLGIALSIASSARDVGVDPQQVAVGEVGLSGELRAVSQLDRRVVEAARLGFKQCLIPKASARISPESIELIPVNTLREAIGVGLVRGKPRSKANQDV